MIDINFTNNSFDGCLDSVEYVSRSKSDTEILNDATLVAHLSFDDLDLMDNGPLLINGTGQNYSYILSGRVNAALHLHTNGSFVQITGLRRFGITNWPFSVVVWMNPSNITGGTVVHLSSLASTGLGWCIALLGLSTIGQIVANYWAGSVFSIVGPTVLPNTWTHVVSTYSPSNGQRLFVNGVQYVSSTGSYNFIASGNPMTITLGSSLSRGINCGSSILRLGQYFGALDEFRVYARELTTTEIGHFAKQK